MNIFGDLNALCANTFGEAVDYTRASGGRGGGGTVSGVNAIVDMDDVEERRDDGLYVRAFFDLASLAQTPEQGDIVSVAIDASPTDLLGGQRNLPLGSEWTVFESLVDPARGAYVRLRLNG